MSSSAIPAASDQRQPDNISRLEITDAKNTGNQKGNGKQYRKARYDSAGVKMTHIPTAIKMIPKYKRQIPTFYGSRPVGII
ncbi:hypothetical protein NC796_02670 [Aliifodinibius sp. S!AR15-10]|uniref:hypothetical protein n=1 Tax=Aliifodinibius sp. S!AR15-10 TaxID=2950437 RepID=UPI00285C3B6F|nr:hypothetical protein [Aliifodinibius sp. S!AR15-10]MDR8390026.1 hypothetical protein [Aliifodinibius sp. S!AR15-10]